MLPSLVMSSSPSRASQKPTSVSPLFNSPSLFVSSGNWDWTLGVIIISISADLVEEVGRSIGYDRVPEVAPLIATKGSVRSLQLKYELEIMQALQGMGYSEVYNYTFFILY